jgi:hypothetical protein
MEKNDDVTLIDNFFNQEAIEWCCWYYNQFTNHRFNKIKHIQETYWNLPFNRWFGNYLKSRIKKFIPEAILHSAYIGNDVKPGGVHTDGWLYEGEMNRSYKTILIPLKFNVKSSTVIFNESSAKGMTLNKVTGLGTDGIDSMQQCAVIDVEKPFCAYDHQQWLSHLDISGLSGLTIHSVLEWIPGRAMSWNRSRWHGPAAFPEGNVERYHLTIMTHV